MTLMFVCARLNAEAAAAGRIDPRNNAFKSNVSLSRTVT